MRSSVGGEALLLCGEGGENVFSKLYAYNGDAYLSITILSDIGSYLLSLHKKRSRKEKKSSIASIDGMGNLTIRESGLDLSNVLRISEVQYITTGYEPEKMHFGAVSVGGVTTGGTYTTGGYEYASSTMDSGRYSLDFKNGDEYQTIRTITLPFDLFLRAYESDISDFLNKKTQQIVVIVDALLTETEKQQMAEMTIKTGSVYNYTNQEMLTRGYPSYHKCEKIKNWLITNCK